MNIGESEAHKCAMIGRLPLWAAGAQSCWGSVVLRTRKTVWNMLQNHLTRGWGCWGIYLPAPISWCLRIAPGGAS